jgi:UDP-N-acetylmuramoyl-L-alanyl-D-glutamate--2,6-diaminopimelate ligase
VRLERLLGDVEVLGLRGDPATDVRSVSYDSRTSVAGALFCCVPGEHADGHEFASAAVDAGAVALLCSRPLALDVTQVRVRDVRAAMARVAAAFHDHPSRRLEVAGITGTNGKTTTAHLLQAVLEADGRRTGLLGTLSGTRTTPEAPDLQAQFARWRDESYRSVAMEVSSHALEQHRVDATWFSVAVFTNLSQDHLDFHGTMEAYFQAKARLFTTASTAKAVVNIDDPHGRLLADAAQVPTRVYSMADAVDLEIDPRGSTFGWEGERVRLQLRGALNVANALAAAAAARELGVGPASVAAGLGSVASVPGRFEVIDAGQPFTVVVDYAHTPAGLEHLLADARRNAQPGGLVLVVFGCGGDRDREKRPLMGAVAARHADQVIVTSDNPRHEDPDAIIAAIRAGVAGATGDDAVTAPVFETDRRAAIRLAFDRARAGDVVVIAGKGHETTQVVADREIPFDDRTVAREELGELTR